MSEKSIEAQAWDATKLDTDPEWAAMPNREFRDKLQFAADRVKATGTASTNFEREVLSLYNQQFTVKAAAAGDGSLADDFKGPMAVVPDEVAELQDKVEEGVPEHPVVKPPEGPLGDKPGPGKEE